MSGQITIKEFSDALSQIKLTEAKRCFLQAHYDAAAKSKTATQLKEAADYQNYGGINLQYARIGNDIAKYLGREQLGISVVCDFIPPRSATNRNWVLVMKPEFAKALKRSGIVSDGDA